MAPSKNPMVVQIAPRSQTMDDSRRIQDALDAAGECGGGIVRLEPGRYVLTAPLRVFSHTVLESVPGAERAQLVRGLAAAATLAADADYGEDQVTVRDSRAFTVGMGIAVRDEAADDWLVSTAVITRIEGNRIYLDRRLVYDYVCDNGGRVETAASMIEAVSSRDVVVRNLVLNGSGGHAFLNGCRGAGIYFYDVYDSEISGVEVGFYSGDGISWQISDAVQVSHVIVHHAARHGFHPGTGALHTRVCESQAYQNGGDGLYLCWRVQGGIFAKNRFADNVDSGISVGHKDTDNQFHDNIISGNHRGGIFLRAEKESNGGHRNVFARNFIQKNRVFGIAIFGWHGDISIQDNTFDGQVRPVWATEPNLAVQSDVPVDRTSSHD